MIKIIVAVSNNGVIGKDNKLLWRQSEDLKRFKSLTLNQKVVMGRKTFESIGKPLPNRENFILTRQKIEVAGCEILHTIEEVLEIDGDVIIIGGGEIYQEFINISDEIYLTKIDCEIEGDTYFPNINEEFWKLDSEDFYKKDDKNQFNWSYQKWVRRGLWL